MRGLGQIEILQTTGHALIDTYMDKVAVLRQMVFSNTGLSKGINLISEYVEDEIIKDKLLQIRAENLDLISQYVKPLLDKLMEAHEKFLPKIKLTSQNRLKYYFSV